MNNGQPPVGQVNFGDLGGLEPICLSMDRQGLAIDRFYIARFLDRYKNDIRGHVLEFQDDRYGSLLGGGAVEKVDVLDIDAKNIRATIIGDVTSPGTLPRETFDCIILTQGLQEINDAKSALASLHASLKPGGVLLVTVPGMGAHEWAGVETEWSFNRLSARRLFGETFGAVEVVTYGNILAVIGDLHGLSVQDIGQNKLLHNDPRYPVTIAVRAVKSGEP
jgi:SAM-dependent methyltransferase